MKPVSNRIEFVRGDTYYISRYFLDEDGNNLTINVNTDEVIFTMKKDITSEALITKKLTEGGITVIDNKYVITIKPDDTEDLDFGKYSYDIEVTIGVEEEIPFRRTVESGIIRLLKKDYTLHSGGGQNE